MAASGFFMPASVLLWSKRPHITFGLASMAWIFATGTAEFVAGFAAAATRTGKASASGSK
ncbi:hypothetical protein GCM10007387_39890 [Pseudoduganella albidiflava]|uniref:Uncharacterized protein n=1 Tax=Pseudoduganella albidiflava TaxID=321983 RepID=A0AA87XZC6_9BURK|nr:hypothetical protein GCM10007387_39890 [Pseudoduganella albidiflava]